jgi:hypothetical protein
LHREAVWLTSEIIGEEKRKRVKKYVFDRSQGIGWIFKK